MGMTLGVVAVGFSVWGSTVMILVICGDGFMCVCVCVCVLTLMVLLWFVVFEGCSWIRSC